MHDINRPYATSGVTSPSSCDAAETPLRPFLLRALSIYLILVYFPHRVLRWAEAGRLTPGRCPKASVPGHRALISLFLSS